jgi:predicted alpha/beta-hydrolase family hydrolase
MLDDREFLLDGPASAPRTVVLAHGAGAPMDSPFMSDVARGLAARGLRVVRFEFPYMKRRREGGRVGPPDPGPVLEARWLSVIAHLGDPARLVIGGKSLGGRIASLVADRAGVAGLVCLGYPFHAPDRPDRPRTAHLRTLGTPALIVQGTRDPFGLPGEIATYALAPAIRVTLVEDGDHSFRPRAVSGRTEAQNLEAVVAAVADFVAGLGT